MMAVRQPPESSSLPSAGTIPATAETPLRMRRLPGPPPGVGTLKPIRVHDSTTGPVKAADNAPAPPPARFPSSDAASSPSVRASLPLAGSVYPGLYPCVHLWICSRERSVSRLMSRPAATMMPAMVTARVSTVTSSACPSEQAA